MFRFYIQHVSVSFNLLPPALVVWGNRSSPVCVCDLPAPPESCHVMSQYDVTSHDITSVVLNDNEVGAQEVHQHWGVLIVHEIVINK